MEIYLLENHMKLSLNAFTLNYHIHVTILYFNNPISTHKLISVNVSQLPNMPLISVDVDKLTITPPQSPIPNTSE